ncbi:hypothetical protein RF640_05060 [Kocuria sp. CPCC 205231]|uniref:hypothetical protein n=1 Tax=Kocuria sp. CPCC 205231 TaxID=3073551 RepID=UPI0034D71597
MISAAQWISIQLDSLVGKYAPNAVYLGVLRIIYALHILLFPVDYQWVGSVPAAFFNTPPGLLAHISEQPSAVTLTALEIGRGLLAVLVLVGYRTKLASVLLGLFLIYGAGFTHSFSKIDHFILYDLFPIFMGLAGWGCRISLDSRRNSKESTRGLPMFLWALTVGFALLTAAIPKALKGWLDPSREASRGYIARDVIDGYDPGLLSNFLLEIDSSLFWKFLDYATLVAEAGVIFAIFSPAFFRVAVIVMLGFHIGVYLSLGINFSHYFLIYAAFFAFPVRFWFRAQTNCSNVRPHSSRMSKLNL